MMSLSGQEFESRSFLYRAPVTLVILIVTIAVSAIWEMMVYAIPVVAVLLFLAAGLKGLNGYTTTRHLDETSAKPDRDANIETDVLDTG